MKLWAMPSGSNIKYSSQKISHGSKVENSLALSEEGLVAEEEMTPMTASQVCSIYLSYAIFAHSSDRHMTSKILCSSRHVEEGWRRRSLSLLSKEQME